MKQKRNKVIVLLTVLSLLFSCQAFAGQQGAALDMDSMAWWQKINAFEIYVNSYQDSDGDGYGDLEGIRRRLDHLKSLGVGAVWLTPFIYQGEELGFKNVSWDSIDCYDDLNSRSQYETALDEGYTEEEAMEFVHRFSRDNARTPMQWDESDQAGLGDEEDAQILMSNYDDTDGSIGVLRPYEAMIVRAGQQTQE